MAYLLGYSGGYSDDTSKGVSVSGESQSTVESGQSAASPQSNVLKATVNTGKSSASMGSSKSKVTVNDGSGGADV